MKRFGKITVVLLFLAIGIAGYAESQFYFKGGGGLGYDSNVLESAYPYQSVYANLSLAGQYVFRQDSFSIFTGINADSEIYDVFYYLNAGINAGVTFSPDPANQIKIQGQYAYLKDIQQTVGGFLEYSQDLMDVMTLKFAYEFVSSSAAAGVTDEQYLSHEGSVSWNVDLWNFGYAEVRIQDRYTDYAWILVSADRLKHNALTGGIVLTWVPDAVIEAGVTGQYTWHDSFVTNLTVFADTNGIGLYNTASVWETGADFKVNWSSAFTTALSYRYSLTTLYWRPVTESGHALKVTLEYFISESLKLELPVTYTSKTSSLSGAIDRWKAEGNVYYLF